MMMIKMMFTSINADFCDDDDDDDELMVMIITLIITLLEEVECSDPVSPQSGYIEVIYNYIINNTSVSRVSWKIYHHILYIRTKILLIITVIYIL